LKSLITLLGLLGIFSIGLGDDPPVIANQAKSPTVPTAAQDLTVTADLTDDVSLSVTEVRYAINGGSESSVSMSNTSGDEYSGTIPSSAYTDGDRVTFYVYVEDGAAQSTTSSSTWGIFAGTTNISSFIVIDGNGAPAYEYNYARVTGVAIVSTGVFGTAGFSFFLQDGTGGVKVQKSTEGISATLGNSYTVVGRMRNTNGQFWIECDDPATEITDNGSSTLPSIQILTISQILADPESFQSEFIGIQHLSKSSGTWPTSGNWATITMTDDGGSNTLLLYIDEDTNIDDNSEPSWPRDVQGILTQYDSSSPYTDAYQIMPRYYSDIQTDGSLPVELSAFTGNSRNGYIQLKWVTDSEIENLGFKIYRQTTGIAEEVLASFENNKQLMGHGSTNEMHMYSYDDYKVEDGVKYTYWLSDVDYQGTEIKHDKRKIEVTFTAKPSDLRPDEFFLLSASPNPFNPTTTISYDLPEQSIVTLTVFDIAGREVMTLEQSDKPPGNYQIQWNGLDQSGNLVSTGVYFCRLEAGAFSQTIKMVYLR
jgi:hypothetical protein